MLRAVALAIAAFSCGGCLVFGSYQSVRIVEPGAQRTTVSLSRNSFLEDGQIRSRILRDHLALDLPLSILVGDFSFSTLLFHPGLIGSLRAHRTLELNAHARTFLLLHGEDRPIYAYGAGLAWSRDLSRWAIRPEVSALHFRGSQETYLQAGIGVEVPFGRSREEANTRVDSESSPCAASISSDAPSTDRCR